MNKKTELRKVKCGQRTVEYLLTRKPVKNINLRIRPDGMIYVSAGKNVPAEYIDGFIESRQAYIIKALEHFEERSNQEPEPREYVSGEHIYYLGRKLRLKVEEGTTESVRAEGDLLILTVKDKENQKRREMLIKNWFKERQIQVFHPVCRNVFGLFEGFQVEYPQIKIRRMKSMWGSCRPVQGIITLNSRLIEVPPGCIEYVVLHEFAHLIHPNHSKSFHELVTLLMPDWKERKKELNSFLLI